MNRTRLFVSMLLVLGAGVTLAEAPEKKCCFKNSAYTGVCEATPAEGESCKSILEYLNTPNSVGKSYCGGTQIRGGWEATSCKPAK